MKMDEIEKLYDKAFKTYLTKQQYASIVSIKVISSSFTLFGDKQLFLSLKIFLKQPIEMINQAYKKRFDTIDNDEDGYWYNFFGLWVSGATKKEVEIKLKKLTKEQFYMKAFGKDWQKILSGEIMLFEKTHYAQKIRWVQQGLIPPTIANVAAQRFRLELKNKECLAEVVPEEMWAELKTSRTIKGGEICVWKE